ncbi:MAG: thymidylate synthase [Candidatus Freyarchaeota archaeon]|nr:thymidylate synthase [Candidatus Freyrarchaeum guaymaensis]
MKAYGPYLVRVCHIDGAWRQVNRIILQKGVPLTTEDKKQETLETIGCVIHLTNWRSGPPLPRGYIGMDLKTLQESYIPQYITSERGGHTYTYGWCARKRFQVDQVKQAKEKLKEDRVALIQLWNPVSDIENANPPCINMILFHRVADVVHVTVYIRSNDMARAYPDDVAGINRVFLTEVASQFRGIRSIGTTTTISASAHIYKTSEEDVKLALEQNQTPTYTHERTNRIAGPIMLTATTPQSAIKRVRDAFQRYAEKQDDSTKYLYLTLRIEKAEPPPNPPESYYQLLQELEKYEGKSDEGERKQVNQIRYVTQKIKTAPQSRRIVVTVNNPKKREFINPLLIQFLPRLGENHMIAFYTNVELEQLPIEIQRAAAIQSHISKKSAIKPGMITLIITPLLQKM